MSTKRMPPNTLLIAAAIAVIGIVLASGIVSANGGRPFSTTLTGAAEFPVLGDPDGAGSAILVLNQGQGQICYEISVSDIETATAAHIHEAPSGAAGPVVVGLAAPVEGTSSACVDVDRDLIKEIRQNPENYYVNVHNTEFPGGALRGQLAK